MTLAASGSMSLAGTVTDRSIQVELGGNGSTQMSMNDTAVRDLGDKPTAGSAINMSTDFYGKSADTNPINRGDKLYPHSLRGGNFASTATSLGSSFREQSNPMWKRIDPQIPKSQWWFPEAPFVGMRLVRPLIPPSPEEIYAYYTQAPIVDY